MWKDLIFEKLATPIGRFRVVHLRKGCEGAPSRATGRSEEFSDLLRRAFSISRFL